VGEKAPDFELTSTKGGKLKLSDLRGKNVLINFYRNDFDPT
jgi:peroxiredoxin